MKIKHYRHIIFLSILALSSQISCRGVKDITEHNNRLNDKEAQEILFAKDSLNFSFFYSKIGIDYKDGSRSNSFSATVKMKTDSAFCGTLSYGPVIGGTYLINKDSIYFTNKRDKCYISENFSTLSAIFGTDIEYSFFQSLILGLPLGIDKSIKYNHKNTKEYSILSSYKKKDLRKIDDLEEDNIFVQYYINSSTFHLDKISIQVPSDTVEIEIEYLNRQALNEFHFPEITKLKIVHPRDSIFINFEYGSIKLDERKDIDINIPDNYVKCP